MIIQLKGVIIHRGSLFFFLITLASNYYREKKRLEKLIKILKHLSYINLIVFLTTSISVFSQDNFYKRYTVNDGLLSSDNYMTFQDNQGYLWICSPNGLVKFNGVEFKSFTVKDGLPINDIWHIDQDAQGRLWVGGYFNGLYYIQNDSIFKLNAGNRINSLIYTNESTNSDTLFFFSVKEHKGYYYSNNTLEINHSKIQGLSIIPAKKKGLTFYVSEKSKGYARQIRLNEKGELLNINTGRWKQNIINFDQQFIFSINYLLIFNDSLLEVHNPEKFFGGKISSMLTITPTQEVMVVVDDTLKVYSNLLSKKRDFKLEKKLKPFIDQKISWITLDSENNLWLTLFRSNIIFIPDNNQLVASYSPKGNYEQNFISIAQTKDSIYLLSFDGNLFSFDSENKKINPLTDILVLNWDDRIRSICSYRQELVIARSSGITRIENNKKTEFRKENQVIFNPRMIEFVDDNHIITSDFLLYELENNGKLTLIDDKNRINSRTHLVISNDNFYVSGGVDGVYFLDKKTKKVRFYPINDVQCLYFVDDLLLIGTNGLGLILMNFEGEILNTYHVGLSVTDIKKKNNRLFLGTNRGIMIEELTKDSLIHLKTITNSDGLLSKDISSLDLNDSILYVGTVNGFNTVKYNEILTKKTAVPKIYLDKIKINLHDFPRNKHLLEWNENTVSFKFSGISFQSMGDITYKYHLLGISDQWVKTKKNEITFWSLPAGNYSFEAIAISSNGVESNLNISHAFTIKKHFTETVGFKLAIILLALLFLGILLTYFQRRKTKRLEMEKRFAQIEMQALQSQMNPHFIFNALNALQSIMFLKGERESNKFIGIFSKLMRVTLNNSKKSTISLHNELEYLTLYIDLEKRRLNNNLEYEIQVDDELEIDAIKIPSMLFQPLVENAIVHGLIPKKHDRRLTIKFYIEDQYLVGEVIDNGIGRKQAFANKKSNEYKSWASTILKEKIEVLNRLNPEKVIYKIIDLEQNGIPLGTRIIIKLPLNYGTT